MPDPFAVLELDHRHVEALFEQLAESDEGPAVESLKGGITHHVEEEEGEMFPKLRSDTDADVQQRLATDFIAAKRAASLPVVPPETTNEQFVDMARDLDIDGRSTMNRDQLIEAVTQAT